MSKISKIQTYAALWLNHNGLSVVKIAEELNLTEKQITNVIEPKKDSGVKTTSEPVGSSRSKNMMIRETANKKSHVAIMTKESSMINDEIKKNQVKTKLEETPGIYRPNGR